MYEQLLGDEILERQPKDRLFGIIFGIMQMSSWGIAIYASRGYHKTSECDVLYEENIEKQFYRKAIPIVAATSMSTIILANVFLKMCEKYAEHITKTVITFQLVSPIMIGTMLINTSTRGVILSYAYSVLSAIMFYLWRNELKLCTNLLKVAAEGLQENMKLIWIIVLKCILLIGALPHIAGIVYASKRGRYIHENDKCIWEMENWTMGYIPFACLNVVWYVMLLFDMRLYIISGTISKWYMQTGNVKIYNEVLNAISNSFGSLCFSSLIMTIVQFIRGIFENISDNRNRSIAEVIVNSCAQCILAFVEFMTKFAVIQMSMTGESFCKASKTVTDLLKRNGMSSYGVWWIPPMIMHTTTAAVTGLVTIVTLYVSKSRFSKENLTELGIAICLSTFVIFSMFNTLMLNIIDTIYLCYAKDKDDEKITRQDIHDVYEKIPEK